MFVTDRRGGCRGSSLSFNRIRSPVSDRSPATFPSSPPKGTNRLRFPVVLGVTGGRVSHGFRPTGSHRRGGCLGGGAAVSWRPLRSCAGLIHRSGVVWREVAAGPGRAGAVAGACQPEPAGASRGLSSAAVVFSGQRVPPAHGARRHPPAAGRRPGRRRWTEFIARRASRPGQTGGRMSGHPGASRETDILGGRCRFRWFSPADRSR